MTNLKSAADNNFNAAGKITSLFEMAVFLFERIEYIMNKKPVHFYSLIIPCYPKMHQAGKQEVDNWQA